MNEVMENYVRANSSAPIYDPHAEEKTLSEDTGEADYVIENVDQRLEDLKLHQDVEEIEIQEQGEGDAADTQSYGEVGIVEEDNADEDREVHGELDDLSTDVPEELERDVNGAVTSVDDLDHEEDDEELQDIIQEPEPRYNLRPNRAQSGRWSGRSYGLHLTIKQAMSKLGHVATKAILKEMDQMISKNVFHPVLLDELSTKDRRSIICCSMFLKEKYKADGSFDKVKARLVAGGHQQDRTVYGDKLSSPTVAISSVFMISVIAAGERREVVTLDIPGAYLHAEMPTDCAVHMRLNKYLSNIMIQLSSHYAKYLNDDGTIVVRLDKALYGCVQSSKLWYDRLCEVLREMGYTVNAEDKCVFNKMASSNQITICVHVDDLLMTCIDQKLIVRRSRNSMRYLEV